MHPEINKTLPLTIFIDNQEVYLVNLVANPDFARNGLVGLHVSASASCRTPVAQHTVPGNWLYGDRRSAVHTGGHWYSFKVREPKEFPTDDGVPNLDAMSQEDLLAYKAWLSDQVCNVFNDQPAHDRTVARAELSAYCTSKVQAMNMRLDGFVSAALVVEADLDARYKQLPEWARW